MTICMPHYFANDPARVLSKSIINIIRQSRKKGIEEHRTSRSEGSL